MMMIGAVMFDHTWRSSVRHHGLPIACARVEVGVALDATRQLATPEANPSKCQARRLRRVPAHAAKPAARPPYPRTSPTESGARLITYGCPPAEQLLLATRRSGWRGALESRQLGRTGLRVSRLGYGLAGIMHRERRGEDISAAGRVLEAVLNGGINFLDSAAAYGSTVAVRRTP